MYSFGVLFVLLFLVHKVHNFKVFFFFLIFLFLNVDTQSCELPSWVCFDSFPYVLICCVFISLSFKIYFYS